MESPSNYKYDVFISYSRKDYVDETTNEAIPNNPISIIKDVFDKNDITYWFDEKGIYSGQAFVDIITEAIAVSKSFVFISSKHSNRSKWTKSEVLEAYDSDKTIIPFKIDDTEYDKSLRFYLRPIDFISYYDNQDKAIEELIRSVQKVKDEIAEEEAKKQKEAEQIAIKARIKDLIEDYHRLTAQQETIHDELVEQSRLLGMEDKRCPICGKSSKIDILYCGRCGWTFHPLFALDEGYSSPHYKVLYSIFKAQWKSNGRMDEIKKKTDELTIENEQLQKELEEALKTINEERRSNAQKESEVVFFRDEATKAQKQLAELTSENKQLKKNLNKASEECNKYIKTIKEKETEVKTIQAKYSKLAESERYYKEIANLLETQKNDLEQTITSLRKELSAQTTLHDQYEQKIKELEINYQKKLIELETNYQKKLKELEINYQNQIQRKIAEIEGKLPSARIVHKQITKQTATELILNSRINSYLSLFPQDKVAGTISFTQLKNNLESYGIKMSYDEFLSCETVERLKEAILLKS